MEQCPSALLRLVLQNSCSTTSRSSKPVPEPFTRPAFLSRLPGTGTEGIQPESAGERVLGKRLAGHAVSSPPEAPRAASSRQSSPVSAAPAVPTGQRWSSTSRRSQSDWCSLNRRRLVKHDRLPHLPPCTNGAGLLFAHSASKTTAALTSHRLPTSAAQKSRRTRSP